MAGGSVGDVHDFGYLEDALLFEVEVEEVAVVVVVELRNEVVEPVVEGGVGLVGNSVAEVLVELDKAGHALVFAHALGGDIEGYLCDPGVDIALVPEGGPALPKDADDVLVEVPKVVGIVAVVV